MLGDGDSQGNSANLYSQSIELGKGKMVVTSEAPRISVVIPTVGRPELLEALQSVVGQTAPVHEIIVVADTADALPTASGIAFTELRVGPGAGGNAARQAGIEAATGELIALLDEDDVWHADRLESQLAAAVVISDGHDWISTSRVVAQFSSGKSEIWPDKLMQDETLPDYLLRKTSIKGGVGFVQASTLLFERELALRVPFDASLKFHQDLSWLIDVANSGMGVRLEQIDRPLVNYRVNDGSVSRSIRSRESTAWGLARLGHCSPRARGDFLMTTPVVFARRSGDPIGVLKAALQAIRHGSPGLPAIGFAAGCLLVSITVRLKMMVGRR